MLYNAFISYSHAADGKLAPALQSGLRKFAKPWYRRRALRVFRDETSLSANPGLWDSIANALAESEYFLFLASPEAAASHWVQEEVGWWLANRSVEKLFVVLTSGELIWDAVARDFDWNKTTALPGNLRGQFTQEPLYVDLRWAKKETHLSLRNTQFRGAILDLAAPLHGTPKDELDGEDVRQHRRVVWTAAGVLIMILLAVGYAYQQNEIANVERATSYVATANANRRERGLGGRLQSLELLKRAAEIRPLPQARDAAMATMSLVDLRSIKQWDGHPDGTAGLRFDPKLERYARSDGQGTISLRRVEDDQEIMRLPGPGAKAWVLRFSRDAHLLAAKYDDLNLVQLWDLSRGEVVAKWPGGVCNEALDFSWDGRWLAIGQCVGSVPAILLFDLNSRQEIKRFIQKTAPQAISFHPKRRWIAVSSEESGDLAVQVLDVDTGTIVRTLPHPSRVWGVAWSDDGNLLAAACHDYRIYVWDVTNGSKPLAILIGHWAEPTQVAFSPGGHFLSSVGWDGTFRLWDPLQAIELITGRSDDGGGLLQFSVDGDRLAWALGGSRLGVWEVEKPHEYHSFYSYREPTKGPWSADFTRDGRLLASAHADGIRLWNVSTGTETAFVSLGYVRTIILHPDGQRMITCGRDSGVNIWSITSAGNLPATTVRIGPPHLLKLPKDVMCNWASLGADRRTLAVADDGHGRVIVLDLENGTIRSVLPGHPKIDFVTISPNGRWIASGSWGLTPNRIGLSDLTRASPDWELKSRFSDTGVAMAFSPDGKWLVTGTAEEYRVWEVGTWKPFDQLRKEPAAVGPVAFAPDGKILAIKESAQEVKLYNPVSKWKGIATLETPGPTPTSSLAFSPDGSQLAITSLNHLIAVWDLRLIRERLASMKLDWDLPAYRPASGRLLPEPLNVTVLMK